MKAVGKVVGWILVLIGIVAVGVVVYLIVSDRIPGNFLAGLMLSAPGLLLVVIGSAMIRASSRRADSMSNPPDPEWTRKRIR